MDSSPEVPYHQRRNITSGHVRCTMQQKHLASCYQIRHLLKVYLQQPPILEFQA